MTWTPIPIDAALMQNVEEPALPITVSARLENLWQNEVGALVDFPGLRTIDDVTFAGKGTLFLREWSNDLILVTHSGQVFRRGADGTTIDVTGSQVTGGGRPTFADTGDELLIAAGGPVVRLRKGSKTEILPQAPHSTHIAYVSGYVVAIERNSGRFSYSSPADYTKWNPIDVFTADGNPDPLIALVRTTSTQLVMAGTKSLEAFAPAARANQPFYRQYSLGTGIYQPYAVCEIDGVLWSLDDKRQFVRSQGAAAGTPESSRVRASLQMVNDWTGAWVSELSYERNRFVLLQAPLARNRYDDPSLEIGSGLTLAYDWQRQKWCELFGFDLQRGKPSLWPGRSWATVFRQNFVGGDGVLYQLDGASATNGGDVKRRLLRTGFARRGGGEMAVNGFRLTLNRGLAPQNQAPATFTIRLNKDGMGWGRTIERTLGLAGMRYAQVTFPAAGRCRGFQIEIGITDPSVFEVIRFELDLGD